MASNALFASSDLGGGVRLHLRRTKAFKTVAARLVFHTDLDEGTAARALVPRVLGRGTRRLPSLRELQIELDRLYGASLSGDTRKMGDRHLIQIRSDWITDRLAEGPLMRDMAGLWAEYLHEPAVNGDGRLRAEVVAHERKMMADEAAAIVDDKARYARHRLVEEMCRGEAFARPSIGRLEEIRAVEVDRVHDAYVRLLSRAPVDLFLVGDIGRAAAERFARGLRLNGGRRPARLRATRRKRPGRVRTVRETEQLAQAKLVMGFRTRLRYGGPLGTALSMMNALFGGTPVGKLFKIVREQESLCYSIGSMLERTKGLLLVHAGIDIGNYRKTRRLIVRQLEALQRGEVSEQAFAQARGILLSGFNSLRDSPSALIDMALESVVNGREADLDTLLEELAAVRVRDVARAARSVELDTVFVLGDAA